MSQPLRESLLLIPCSGLDDFPESLSSLDSHQVLSGWLALWHPSLISKTHGAPRWQSADQPPHDFSGVLAVVPAISQPKLPSDMAGTAERGGGWLLAADGDWKALQADWIQRLPELPRLDTALAATWQIEFAALGYAYLQIQLLTRQLRYTSNLDQILFDSQLDQAAQAAITGEAAEAEKMLQSCFDQLGQERDHYYSLDVSLIDVTLLAPTTLGAAVTRQLARPYATTFVANADLLRKMQHQHPQVAAELREAVKSNRISLAGGLDIERPHALMSFDALKRDLTRGRTAYRELDFDPPRVFTRFSYGQLSDMPLHLRRSGFVATLLIAWQDGVYPSGSHAKFSWEASEGTFLNAVAPPLADAQDAATYLTLGRRVAEALDHQHVPIFMLAHWPDSYSPFFELLQRAVARTPALGRWQNADDFFEKTDQPYHQEHLPPRKFLYDWLSPEHASDPSALIACSIAHQRLAARAGDLQNVLNLCYQLENFHAQPTATTRSLAATPKEAAGSAEIAIVGSNSNIASNADSSTDSDTSGTAGSSGGSDSANSHGEAEADVRALSLQELDSGLAGAADGIDALFDAAQAGGVVAAIQSTLDRLAADIGRRFARAAGHRPLPTPASVESAGNGVRIEAGHADAAAALAINACSAPQRLTLHSAPRLAPASGGSWLYASGVTQSERLSMVDVPGHGMLKVPLLPTGETASRREKTLVQSEGSLLNDFLEIQVDPRTGNLRSLHVPGKRGNRLSIQLARREKRGAGPAEFSTMVTTDVRTIENSSVLGCVRAQGHMQFGGDSCGEFEIDYQLARGSRVLRMTMRLSSLQRTNGSPWLAAYVLRTAWPNESAVVTLRNCGSRHAWTGGKAVAPLLIEIDEAEYHTYLLTGGLAFHQRVDQRFLETLLTTGASGDCEFQFGVGVDLPSPVVSARQFLNAPLIVPLESKPSGQSTSQGQAASNAAAWLMHIDAKHVVMELESPLVDRSGCCVGMRVHLTEVANKSVTLRIRALREVAEAHRVDYLGGRIAKLTVEGDTTSIALRPSEMTFVDLLWKLA